MVHSDTLIKKGPIIGSEGHRDDEKRKVRVNLTHTTESPIITAVIFQIILNMTAVSKSQYRSSIVSKVVPSLSALFLTGSVKPDLLKNMRYFSCIF